MTDYVENRKFLKDSLRKTIDFRRSDQSRGVPVPPVQEPVAADSLRIELPGKESWEGLIVRNSLVDAIGNRQSRRKFSSASLQLGELSFLLWATQGLRGPGTLSHFRTVPSAGARHSFETYLFINRVEGVSPGLYRYLPLSHEIVLVRLSEEGDEERLARAVFGQNFVAKSALVFAWASVPYRMEWRYLQAAHRVILLDAGHVCQNLYLACEAIDAGTCAIAAYDQEALDMLLGVDGQEQFALYLAPVGKYS